MKKKIFSCSFDCMNGGCHIAFYWAQMLKVYKITLCVIIVFLSISCMFVKTPQPILYISNADVLKKTLAVIALLIGGYFLVIKSDCTYYIFFFLMSKFVLVVHSLVLGFLGKFRLYTYFLFYIIRFLTNVLMFLFTLFNWHSHNQ